jgi:plasmid stabilization system protein ParE
MRLLWTLSTAADLEQISDYLYEHNPELANRTIQSILESTTEFKKVSQPRQARS